MAASNKKEATLMTVNGKPVSVSEFKYLYNKNNQQQAEPQSLDEYVDMFVNYKLKVADAEAAGIDTTQAFRKEYAGYCQELAAPYLNDTTINQRLRDEAYERMKTNVNVSHIMMPLGRTPDEKYANRQRLDSIRNCILAGEDFGTLAERFSADRSAKRNKGNMGFVNAGTLPYPFEIVAWTTPVGEISPVFEDAPYGWHIIRVEGTRPNPGEVRASHILKLTRGLSPEQQAQKKAQIDSILTLVKNGGDFEAIATAESEDPGSAKQGGVLPWFGPGQMVKEFEVAAFSLPDNAVSDVIETSYGYHIIKKLGHRDMGSKEEVMPKINKIMTNDVRSQMPRQERVKELRTKLKAKLDPKVVAAVQKKIANKGAYDSIMARELAADWTTMATVGGKKVLVSNAAQLMPKAPMSATAAGEEFAKAADTAVDNAVVDNTIENLSQTDPEYGNLVNEYRDGILLFEISNRNVWDKSNKDREGVKKFFEANRDKYTWDAPRYKTIIVSATSDSVADLAQKYLQLHSVEVDSLVTTLRGEFGRNIKVERKIFPKGEDAVVDYLGFGGEKPTTGLGKWVAFFEYEGHKLNAPEEAGDVRSQVVNDYQQWLEAEWIKELHKKYPVKINDKELKKLKENK
ncbi:MAG: peptidylprolyl isomerase [Muribaculaceae bacterium]|nr:peptidylprolyl isomerase [Muribaculaceae bacterium]